MKVFVVPSWHPMPYHPNWCNWVKPHIEMVRSFADVVVLYVDTELDAPAGEEMPVREIAPRFFHAALPKIQGKYHRTLFNYPKELRRYTARLDEMYRQAVRKYGVPDILHAHVSMPAGYGCARLSRRYGVPCIVTEHYSGFFSDNRFPWRLPLFYRKMRAGIDGFYTVSPGFARQIGRLNIKVDGVTPNPVNLSLFRISNEQPDTEGKSTEAPRLNIVTTGTSHIKGTDILFDAVSRLPNFLDWHLYLVGGQLIAIRYLLIIQSRSASHSSSRPLCRRSSPSFTTELPFMPCAHAGDGKHIHARGDGLRLPGGVQQNRHLRNVA